MQDIIKTKLFILRPLKKGDEPAIFKHVNNPKIADAVLEIPYPYKLKDAVKWVKDNLPEYKKKRPKKFNFGIVIGDQVVGAIGLTNITKHKAEIGYWLGEKFWGKGIMTQAISFVTKYGQEKLGLVRIYGHAFPFNKASMRVLEKNGYQLEGILKKNVLKNKKFLDTHLFAKIK